MIENVSNFYHVFGRENEYIYIYIYREREREEK